MEKVSAFKVGKAYRFRKMELEEDLRSIHYRTLFIPATTGNNWRALLESAPRAHSMVSGLDMSTYTICLMSRPDTITLYMQKRKGMPKE
jgi:hypothetical protein